MSISRLVIILSYNSFIVEISLFFDNDIDNDGLFKVFTKVIFRQADLNYN